MQFKLFTVVAAALSATTGVQALPAAADVVPGLPSPESVISNIQSLTQLAGDTKNIVGGLNALNAPTSAFSLISSFGNIGSKLQEFTGLLNVKGVSNEVAYAEKEQQGICNNFRNFAGTLQTIIQLFGDKISFIPGAITLFRPVAGVLLAFQYPLDGYVRALTPLVPVCSSGLLQDKVKIDDALGNVNKILGVF